MARKYEQPTVTKRPADIVGLDDEYTITHPAYGVISLSRPSGGSQEMFGSDLKHNSRVTLTINRAVEHRSLNTSWIHDKKELIEIDMTEHQWAKFVSSSGMSPTPCTLRHAPEEGFKLERLPEIMNQSNAKEKASAEFSERIAKQVDGGAEVLEKLSVLIANGKANKSQLIELLSAANNSFGRLKTDAVFAIECFEEDMERIVESGRTEIEAHLTNLAHNTGLEVLKQRSFQLEDKK
ncbi:hypothetical protein [Burkholderia pseudomallei]|jgi:hypothetical protein|uniref:hypothetical protein n=1 Tax=Burkholderia pseudomallei TaxID=28450 RepID=UPI0024DFB0C0|nr:hypothetical protein [Burkholderia pseudomallei]